MTDAESSNPNHKNESTVVWRRFGYLGLAIATVVLTMGGVHYSITAFSQGDYASSVFWALYVAFTLLLGAIAAAGANGTLPRGGRR